MSAVAGSLEDVPNLTPGPDERPKVLEFFAGIGLARLGLEAAGFEVSWANDYEPAKFEMYKKQFENADKHNYVVGDIHSVSVDQLPKNATVAWASSPCTDLSLAGSRGGLQSGESMAFWHFVKLLAELEEDRPRIAVLENVVGLASSHGGDDLTAAIKAFNSLGYSVDVLTIDARRFVPQSRPRLFVVASLETPLSADEKPNELRPAFLQSFFADPSLRTHRAALPAPPPIMTTGLSDTVEQMGDDDSRWWDGERVNKFETSLSTIQLDRVNKLKSAGEFTYRTAYRRTRNGVATWEVRPDDISGCLRTARGGSSKQAVVRLGLGDIKVRWMTPLEYARLMGAGDFDLSAARTNQALFAFGDAVAVPVVRWLSENYLRPLAGRPTTSDHSREVVHDG
ncbi:DNA cytosine methyltransferase [Curtobacterium sp. MCPF17_052]|uniref:DNA cytosine methyltransferase n=1 Tax=Curtobacterium sp. MCPF17_052 TaxID=2175655 RepID=UPI001C650402|nr:DNA cytosine methyltransferase [Curtobacterium sp. MCPF17_052]WIB12305.1 DNA cytosine methyltransferase [Curtobacterium sp. MCPF17_052]